MRELRLPSQPILSEDLGRDGELGAALEEARADDDLGAQDRLVVVDVRGAVGAVVAVYWFALRRRGGGLAGVGPWVGGSMGVMREVMEGGGGRGMGWMGRDGMESRGARKDRRMYVPESP